MPTPQDPQARQLQLEQALELISVHIAANDRVVNAMATFEKQFPEQALHVLQEDRAKQPPAAESSTVIHAPDPTPVIRDHVTLTNSWGLLNAILTVLSACLLLSFLLMMQR